jgi:hypothetical protein
MEAEKRGKVDVALKYLYWALTLTRTLRYPNDYKYDDGDGTSFLAISMLPRFIGEIFDNIKVEASPIQDNTVELVITYKGKPVTSADYAYFDGRDWSNLYAAENGKGVLELAPGHTPDTYQMRFEYEYRSERQLDREVASVLDCVSGTPMRGAYKNVAAAKPVAKAKGKKKGDSFNPINVDTGKAVDISNTFTVVDKQLLTMPQPTVPTAEQQAVVRQLTHALESRQYNDADTLFTLYGLDIYTRLVKYGTARIVGTPEYTYYASGDHLLVRGLQLSFSFKTGARRSFVEELIFSMDSHGKFDNLSFGLDKSMEAEILGRQVWNEQARFAILNFLENYQTAYALKRLDYIRTIFDDNAVIITGTVVHVCPSQTLERNQNSKDEYLKSLEGSFRTKEFINLRFDDCAIRQLPKGGELYAIQLSQEYYSSNYGDRGFLFLMVDINDPANPIIKVRTWQPERDPDFGLYGPEHFQ